MSKITFSITDIVALNLAQVVENGDTINNLAMFISKTELLYNRIQYLGHTELDTIPIFKMHGFISGDTDNVRSFHQHIAKGFYNVTFNYSYQTFCY